MKGKKCWKGRHRGRERKKLTQKKKEVGGKIKEYYIFYKGSQKSSEGFFLRKKKLEKMLIVW